MISAEIIIEGKSFVKRPDGWYEKEREGYINEEGQFCQYVNKVHNQDMLKVLECFDFLDELVL